MVNVSFIFHHSSFSQNIASFYDVKFNKLNTENGLPSDIVMDVAQDKHGTMWIATSNGLVRFDGVKMKIYQNKKADVNSLPSNLIQSISFDSKGILWMGTQNGIVKFIPWEEKFIDLHSEKYSNLEKYRSYYSNSYIDSKGRISFIDEYSGNCLILNTHNDSLLAFITKEAIGEDDLGLNEKLSRECVDGDIYWFRLGRSMGIAVNVVSGWVKVHTLKNNLNRNLNFPNGFDNFYKDSKDNIYIANHGLWFLPKNKKSTFQFEYIDLFKGKKPGTNIDFRIYNILEDKENMIWVSTYNYGIKIYNPKTKEVLDYNLKPINYNGIVSTKLVLLKDNNDQIWVKHVNAVLQLYNYKSKSFIDFKHDPSNAYSPSDMLFSENTYRLFYDLSKNYWLITEGKGLEYFSLEKSKFSIIKNLSGNKNSLSANGVWGIYEDDSDNLFLGISTLGLNILDKNSGNIDHYIVDSKPEFSGFNLITSFYQYSDFEYWIGCVPLKQFRYNKTNHNLDLIHEFRPDSNDSTSLSDWVPSYIFKDSKKNIWVGTLNGGLNLYQKPNKNNKHGSFKHYSKDSNIAVGIANNQIWHITEDNSGRLWISTDGGISIMNAEHTKVTNYFHNTQDSNTISSKKIKFTHQDKTGQIWIATEGGGLNKFIEKENRFVSLNKTNGFPSDNIFAIFEDSSGNFWMSSTDGIIKFNPETKISHIFTKDDGLQNNQFVAGAFFQNKKTGKIYFGGNSGINHFFPDSIKLSAFIPKIIFVSFKIFNKEIEVGRAYDKRILLKNAIIDTKEIVLNYTENVFSIEFAALDYTSPKSIKYSYLLEGANDNWIETDAENRVLNYTNLAPGKYILKVKSTNADGVWCENLTSISIIITPPFWQTWWFKILLALSIFGSAYIYYKNKTNEIRQRNIQLERKVTERTHEVMQQKEELQQQAEELEATNEELIAQSDALREANDELIYSKDEIEKSFKISQIISEFGQRVTSTFDLKSINEIVYGYITSIMPSDAFGIGLYNSHKNEIEYIGFIEEGKRIENFTKSLSSENSLSAWCFNTQKTVFVNDLFIEYKNYIYALPNISTNKQPLSIIHLPLSVGNKRLGIIVVNSFMKNAYTEKDLIHLQSLASYITIALDNAEAYKTVNAQKEKLLELDNFKDAMTGMIVHDLKNPLNAIIGLSSMNPDDEMMQMVNSAGNQMLNLVLNILDVQKFENTEVKLNVNELSIYLLADEAVHQVSLLVKQKKQRLINSIPPQTIGCADPEIIVRVFVNMLTNAIKYTPNGGEIIIRQKAIIQNQTELISNDLMPDNFKNENVFKTPFCIICVSDTGQGIPEDKIHLVFEKFGQVEAKKSGGVRSTGLGMTFCKMVIEAHGGNIWIKSEVGKGTDFYFTLPFSKIDTSLPIHHESEDKMHEKTDSFSLYNISKIQEDGSWVELNELDKDFPYEELKILIADDDKYSIDVMRNCLGNWGRTMYLFSVVNGKDAVEVAAKINPDIILLDWEMPELDGLSALKQIKTIPELSKIPVAMITSRSGNTHIQQAFDAGASDYIKKPIDKIEALFRVQTLARISELIQNNSIDEKIEQKENEILNLVLIIDDVFEIRQFIKHTLKNSFLTIEAENGSEGIQKVKDYLPDLIISDINMPEMDGLMFCKELKSNIITSHIPIILLTAQAGIPSNIAGLEAGADEYLNKPIQPDLLLAAIKNQIENREKLRKAFSKIITAEPSEIQYVTSDEKFIAKCIRVVEENISNPEFHIDAFVNELAMSYGQLYGKIKFLTNLSIAGFIRDIRLKRAKQLLVKEKLSVKELMIRVGFENVISFTRIFKREFGVAPGEFAKKMHP